MKQLKIGKLKLKNPLFLSPMVDVTDLPYRILCRRAGVGMAYTEMIYVNAILHENLKTKQMLKTCKEDSPIGLQITGNSEGEFEKFVKMKDVWKDFDLIDLNCGCPSSRIVGNEAGSYLLNSPEKIGRIVKILKKTGKIVTVKTRLGFKKVNILEVARIIESAGADALTVHCRLAVDGNDRKADWSYLSKVKKVVKIPVIGNGDVFSGRDALEMLELCDGVMIGRGAIGDPGIFSRISEYLRLKGINNLSCAANRTRRPEARVLSVKRASPARRAEDEKIDTKENLKLFLEYLKLEGKYYGKDVDLGKVKYVGGKFLRGFSGASEARNKFMGMKNFNEMVKFAEEYRNI
jgi:tRNA-dihydrouridine synthase B